MHRKLSMCGGDVSESVPGERWRTAAVACSLADDGVSERAAEWSAVLAGAGRVPIPEGVRLTLPVARTTRIAELAAAEQACCPFFDFRLHLDGDQVELEVRAPAGAMGMVATLFG